MTWKQVLADVTAVAAACLVGAIVLACGSPAPKTNAEKCAAMGGTYSSAAKTCTFQAE